VTLLNRSGHFNELIRTTDFSFLENARILICGGTGLIGGYLAAALARGCQEQGILLETRIVVTGRRDDHYLHKLEKEGLLEVIQLQSVLDARESQRFTHTFHAASPASPNQFSEHETLNFLNYKILQNLVDMTSEQFIFFSTGEVYGINAPFAVEESYRGAIANSKSRSSYPKSKLRGEQLLNEIAADRQCALGVVRLFHTFGPGVNEKDPRVFSSFLHQAIKERSITLRSNGTQVRSFLHLADAIRGVLQIFANHEPVGVKILNVGSSIPVSIKSFALLVADLTNSQVIYDSPPDFEMSPNHILVPSTKELEKLGWSQKINLAETIQDTLDWLSLSPSDKEY
jgi:UDP-glucuronate decarboxylase